MVSAPRLLRRLDFIKSSRGKALINPASIAFAVLGLCITTFDALAIYEAGQNAHEERFYASCQRIEKALLTRFNAYEQILRGGVAFFEGSENVTREEWASYFDRIDIHIDYPGIQGIGYSVVVPPNEISDFERGVVDEGFTDFKVWPPGVRSPTTSIPYIEPFDVRNRRTFGYDMMSEGIRRKAMQAAIDLGGPALSGRVTLKQEFSTKVQSGFLLYHPHYENGVPLDSIERRRKAIQGFVYSPFRMEDFMKGLLGDQMSATGLRIKDPGASAENAIMYDTTNQNPDPIFWNSITIENSGYPWTVEISSSKQFEKGFSSIPTLAVALAGITITLLGVVVLADSRSTRFRATEIAEKMTLSLRKRKAEILELNSSLEQKVAQRTSKLEVANKELDSFAYTISHDLRTPARHIRGLKKFLIEDHGKELSNGATDYLTQIEKATERMESLIEDMLILARCAHSAPRLASVDLSGMTLEISQFLTTHCPERQIEFSIAPNLRASADPAMCKAIFQNLLENAVKFTAREEVAEISFGQVETEKGNCFYIRDNGAGFDMKYSKKLFSPFKRLHSPSDFPGTGIGLAIVKKMITHHDGKIWAESEKGVGTTFYFCFAKVSDVKETQFHQALPSQDFYEAVV